MDIRFWRQKPKEKQISRPNFTISNWLDAPDRSNKGFLDAYSEVYSLYGITLRIATAVSEVKWRLYKGSDRSERSQVASHPILDLLDYANEFQTGQEITMLTQLHRDLAGRAYWYLPRNKLNVPAEIWVLPPHQVRILADKGKFIVGYAFRIGSEEITFSTEEIIAFPMPDPVSPYGGIGFVQPSAVEIDSEVYAGRWNRNFFYNSARPDGALETEDTLSDEQIDRLRQQWSARYGGFNQAHKTAILEGGLKYKQIAISQKDMDFKELRKQNRENLMFAFGMPLSVMGIVENVNRANAEAGDYCFARWIVKPRLIQMRNKLNEQLLRMYPKATNIELDFDEVVPETIEQKQNLSESGLRSGWMSINEARKLNGFDPIPTGDQILVPLNMIPTPIKSLGIISKGFSEAQKEMRWRGYAIKTERQEVPFVETLASLFNEQKNQLVERLEATNIIINIESLENAETQNKFIEKLKPLIRRVYLASYRDVAGELGSKAIKQDEDYLNPRAIEWIDTRSFELAKNINSTTLIELRRILNIAYTEGEDIATIARRIRGYYDDMTPYRSRMIARTEVIAANNEAAINGYQDYGVQKAEFYVALDERLCDECEALNGQIYPVTESHGIIPVHPNCRCVWLPVVE